MSSDPDITPLAVDVERSGQAGTVEKDPEPGRRHRVPLLAFIAVFGGFLILSASVTWAAFGSLPVALRYLRGERLIVEPARLRVEGLTISKPVLAYADILNYTPNPVRLIGASTRCTCVVAQELPATIPAGGAFRMAFEVKARAETDTVDEPITVFTDNREHPQLRVRVSGTSRP